MSRVSTKEKFFNVRLVIHGLEISLVNIYEYKYDDKSLDLQEDLL